jgi:hypothetical protein
MRLKFWNTVLDILGLCERALKRAYAHAWARREAAR